MPISRRPVAFGRSPAPSPIHAHANIWYGIHGPTPLVMSADAKSVVQPRLKPKPGPSARPETTSRKKIVSTPAVPAPSGRTAAPSAESTPSSASALESRPPSESCASTTASTRQEQRAEDHRRDAVRADRRLRAREERPRERDHTEDRRDRERDDRARPDAYRVAGALTRPRPSGEDARGARVARP